MHLEFAPVEEEPALAIHRLHDVPAVIPVKSLAEAKSRLPEAIPQYRRKQLVLAMLEDVTSALQDSGALSAVVVVSPDSSIAGTCRGLGAEFVLDQGSGLNQAVTQASAQVCSSSCPEALIVFPVDIPLLKPKTVADVVSTLEDDALPLVVAARSKDGGTNMLLRRPPEVIPASFGGSSFDAHRESAERAGIRFITCDSPDLAFDIDTEADLRELLECGQGTRAYKVAKGLLRSTRNERTPNRR